MTSDQILARIDGFREQHRDNPGKVVAIDKLMTLRRHLRDIEVCGDRGNKHLIPDIERLVASEIDGM